MTTATAHKTSHGAAVAPTPHAKPIETSHAATRRAESAPVPPDPLDAVRIGVRDLGLELAAITKSDEPMGPDVRERIGRAQTRLAAVQTALDDHVENVKRTA